MERIVKLESFYKIINYIDKFERDIFQGSISYMKFDKELMLYILFGYFQVYIFLLSKESNRHIDLERFYDDFHETFNNVEYTEQGIVDLYSNINEQRKYIRNVQIMVFIVYKENWNIHDFSKFNKSKNKINYLKKLIK